MISSGLGSKMNIPNFFQAEDVLWGEHNPHTKRGIVKGNGVCTCSESSVCICGNFGLSGNNGNGKHHKGNRKGKGHDTNETYVGVSSDTLNVHKGKHIQFEPPVVL